MNNKVIKGLGVGAAIFGALATVVSNWVSEKQQDAKIAEKVAEAISKSTGKES